MKITIETHPHNFWLTTGVQRSALLLNLTNERGANSWGEVAPLPGWSQETLESCIKQLDQKKDQIQSIDWQLDTCLHQLDGLSLLPALSFGIGSALLPLLAPLPAFSLPVSALLMGSPKEILNQAEKRLQEGYSSAKLKVSQLSFQEAAQLIEQLKDRFRLRIDANRAWETEESLQFFSNFAFDAFDYVEEPLRNPQHLTRFTHPLAVDESFPQYLNLQKLEDISMLKTLVFKPTIQGIPSQTLLDWTSKRGVTLVLSSSFESTVGLTGITLIAQHLSLTAPLGIGTYHYLSRENDERPLPLSSGSVWIGD